MSRVVYASALVLVIGLLPCATAQTEAWRDVPFEGDVLQADLVKFEEENMGSVTIPSDCTMGERCFSPDGSLFAYVVHREKDGMVSLGINGRLGKWTKVMFPFTDNRHIGISTYPGWGPFANRIFFAGDGKTPVYYAVDNGEKRSCFFGHRLMYEYVGEPGYDGPQHLLSGEMTSDGIIVFHVDEMMNGKYAQRMIYWDGDVLQASVLFVSPVAIAKLPRHFRYSRERLLDTPLPDGTKFLFCMQDSDGWWVVAGKRRFGPFTEVCAPYANKRGEVFFIANIDDKWTLVKENTAPGELFDGVGDHDEDSDGNMFFVAFEGDTCRIRCLETGYEGPVFCEIRPHYSAYNKAFLFTRSGKNLLYSGRKNKQWHAVFGDRLSSALPAKPGVWEAAEREKAIYVLQPISGDSLTGLISSSGEQQWKGLVGHMVNDMGQVEAYTWVVPGEGKRRVYLTVDGIETHIGYGEIRYDYRSGAYAILLQGEDSCHLLFKGERHGPFRAIGSVCFYNEGRDFYFFVTEMSGERRIHHREWKSRPLDEDERGAWIKYLPMAKKLLRVTHTREKFQVCEEDQAGVVHEGPVFRSGTEILAKLADRIYDNQRWAYNDLIFCPRNQHYAFIAYTQQGERAIVLDNKIVSIGYTGSPKGHVTPPVFSRDGRKLAYCVFDGKQIWRKIVAIAE